ncbi:MAG TPA: NAD-dependent epimerase/dehydratase family protein [Trebonia sp.]|jgi:nucleoside-diphosphate-sugar epimerase|nr:NAD-dependent epimerase/dehydratase family protein [Trebonia sp.]
MHVFLTGGSGYIGRPTISALRAAGHQVSALARTDQSAEVVRGLGATPVPGDLADVTALRDAAAGADAVIHLGADASTDMGQADRIAAAALQDGIAGRPYVHTGGLWVYGDTSDVITEAAPYHAPAITAWREENERAVLDHAHSGGHPVLVMPAVVFGRQSGLLQLFAEAADGTGAVPYIGDGANYVTLVHVDDIAQLYVRALNAPAGSVYAGVNGEFLTFAQVAAAVSTGAGLGGRTVSISIDEARAKWGALADAFALDQRISGDKARRELGWTPAYTDALATLSSGQ